MSYWRKKPVVIEAFRWTGGPDQTEDPLWIIDALKSGAACIRNVGSDDVELAVMTLEGVMVARPGDWIIKGVAGELYPCKDSIFVKTYEEVDVEP